MEAVQVAIEVSKNQLRPAISPHYEEKFGKIIRACWSQNPLDVKKSFSHFHFH